MNWHEFNLLLADAATSPAMLLICALIVFIAGVAAGALMRLAALPGACEHDTAPEPFTPCRCRTRPVGNSGRIVQIDSSECELHSLRPRESTPAAHRRPTS
jgi:hypothetical protein